MTEEIRKDIDKLEEQLREDLGETFGKDVMNAFDELSKALRKEIEKADEKKSYKGSKLEELEKEIRDFVQRTNKKIDEIKPELKGTGFGLVVASWSCGTPTVFLGAGSKNVLSSKVLPYIKKQLGEG